MRPIGGFTLIELMITLALLGILLTLGFSSSYWSERSRSREAVSQLGAAFSKARALAVRNAAGSLASDPAATVCVANARIYVHTGTPVDCGTDSIWQAAVPGGEKTGLFTDTAMTSSFHCIAVDNRSRVVPSAVGSTSCALDVAITVAHGGWHVDARLM